MKKIIILISLIGFTLLGCDKDNETHPYIPDFDFPKVQDSVKTPVWMPDLNLAKDTFLFEFTDIDSNVYHAIKIGKQIWSKENLKTTHFNDGTPISNIAVSNIPSTTQWIASAGAYCHYNNNASISALYGLLYNYNAAATNKLAPKGWHVSTFDDWNTLMLYIGNQPFPTIGDVGALVDPQFWPEGPFYSIHDYEVQCTNSTFFTALPNGYMNSSISGKYPGFECCGYQAAWWAINNSNGGIIYLDQTFGIFDRTDGPGSVGSGIRLVKDAD